MLDADRETRLQRLTTRLRSRLLNSLTHLTYLTSASPRIWEILTSDGGLQRLLRLLRDFCLSLPPPSENPSAIYGLLPPYSPRSLVVSIGLRGSVHIRSRVVQAGTLEVVGCGLEAWLASKGFAVGPSASRAALRARPTNKDGTGGSNSSSSANESKHRSLPAFLRENAETTVSTDTFENATLLGSKTPTPSASTSRPDTETEDGADVEKETSMTQDQDADESMSAPPSLSHTRRTRLRLAIPAKAGTVGVEMAGPPILLTSTSMRTSSSTRTRRTTACLMGS
ncbi:hypothetical protein DFH11DRAFT_1795058 [Phellopilus nigrolimitatus]|nr:hypothetical protein DFH11DRAFT_1795058 [Phellopilus nigrolimitatus]